MQKKFVSLLVVLASFASVLLFSGLASSHTAQPTISQTLVASTTKKITASGNYDNVSPECQRTGLTVTTTYSGPSGASVGSMTTLTLVTPAGDYIKQSPNLNQGFLYSLTSTVLGTLDGSYSTPHVCNDASASGTQNLP